MYHTFTLTHMRMSMVGERKKVSDKLPKLMETIKKDWQMKKETLYTGSSVVVVAGRCSMLMECVRLSRLQEHTTDKIYRYRKSTLPKRIVRGYQRPLCFWLEMHRNTFSVCFWVLLGCDCRYTPVLRYMESSHRKTNNKFNGNKYVCLVHRTRCSLSLVILQMDVRFCCAVTHTHSVSTMTT